MTGLLDLPAELREVIYTLTLMTERDTYIVLPSYKKFHDEVSATQPSICCIDRQTRAETLPIFYGANIFSASLDTKPDLKIAEQWLAAIGDVNVGDLRRVALCGWTRVPFGHMVSRRWVRVELDLKLGKMKMGDMCNAHPDVLKRVTELDEAFSEIVQARDGRAFDMCSLKELMGGFSLMCTAYC